MEYRIFGSVLAVLFFVLFGHAATATPILATGTPTCDGSGTCDVAITGATAVTGLTGLTTYEITVEFVDFLHLELFDIDSAANRINLLFGAPSLKNTTASSSISIEIAFDFLDMDGNVVAGFKSVIGLLGIGQACGGCGTDASGLPGSFLFHGFRIILTAPSGTSFDAGPMTGVEFTGFGDNSNVGVWEVPEPGTLAIFGMGLLGLAAMRRRKKAA